MLETIFEIVGELLANMFPQGFDDCRSRIKTVRSRAVRVILYILLCMIFLAAVAAISALIFLMIRDINYH